MRITRRSVTMPMVCAGLASLALTACFNDNEDGDDGETIAEGVEYYSHEQDEMLVHVLEVDLTVASVDVLYPGTGSDEEERTGVPDQLEPTGLSDAAEPVGMAEEAGAIGVINGDFFNNHADENEADYTCGSVGPMISEGEHLTAAVPDGQRMGPTRPDGATTAAALAVAGSRAQITDLVLEATATTPRGTIDIAGLNQYAIPENSVGLFTPEWGVGSRYRATCGTDDDRHGGCADDIIEVIVERGVTETDSIVESGTVTEVRSSIDAEVGEVRNEMDGRSLAEHEIALVARDGAHQQLQELEVGDTITTNYQLVSEDGSEFTAAVGGFPLLDDSGSVLNDLDPDVVDPRTVVGYKDGGQTLYMMVIDSAGEGGGATLQDAALYAESLGLEHALNLDGGGSSLLAAGQDGDLEIRNSPTDPIVTVGLCSRTSLSGSRAVINALAVFAEPPVDGSDVPDEARRPVPEDDGASSLEGRWQYRGEFTDIRTLEIGEDGSVTYVPEGSPEYTGELQEPTGNGDYTADLRTNEGFDDPDDEQEMALQLTLSDDGEQLEAYGEFGEVTFERVG